mmetsp:Transcript_47668/g.75382  ORF Transcript_47668/g.75382 Transcript_47668/m.75382 type:complete len:132 (-) Transcript_47668:106-501(-)
MTSFESGPFSTAAEPTSFAAAKKKSSSSKGKKGKKGMPGMPGMPGMDDEEEEELPPLFHGANAGPPNHMAEATRHWGRHTSEIAAQAVQVASYAQQQAETAAVMAKQAITSITLMLAKNKCMTIHDTRGFL